MTSFSTPFPPRAFTCRHYFSAQTTAIESEKKKMRRAFFIPLHPDRIHHLDRISRTVQSYECEPSTSQFSMLLYLLSFNTDAIAKMDYNDDGSDDVYPLEGKHTLHYILSPMCFEIGIERFVVRVLYYLLGSTLYPFTILLLFR